MADIFKASNKAEWTALIEKSAKGKSFDSFTQVHHNLQIQAFNMASDVLHSGTIPRQNPSWKIGVKFNINDALTLNTAILHFLNLGAEAISIQLNKLDDLSMIYKGVHADWIHNDISLNEDIPPNELLSFFPEGTSLSLGNSPNTPSTAISTSLHIDGRDDHAKYLSDILCAAEELHNSGDKLENIVLHVNVGVYLPSNLAFLRALRILWANYIQAKNITNSSLNIAAHIKPIEPNQNIQLIEQCVASMNAAMGGADFIFVTIDDTEDNYQRLALQIQNIMKLESKMELSADALAGSFAIENLTNALAEKAWNNAISILT